MSERLRVRSQASRVMIIPATAGTYYPTGKVLGYDAEKPGFNAGTATSSTTNTDSWFAQGGNNPLLGNLGSFIRSITVLTAGAGSPTIALQNHDGNTVLIPAFDAAAALGRNLGEDGVPIYGGWRVVTVGSTGALVMVVWEPWQTK